jgi:hypothetical protein
MRRGQASVQLDMVQQRQTPAAASPQLSKMNPCSPSPRSRFHGPRVSNGLSDLTGQRRRCLLPSSLVVAVDSLAAHVRRKVVHRVDAAHRLLAVPKLR